MSFIGKIEMQITEHSSFQFFGQTKFRTHILHKPNTVAGMKQKCQFLLQTDHKKHYLKLHECRDFGFCRSKHTLLRKSQDNDATLVQYTYSTS